MRALTAGGLAAPGSSRIRRWMRSFGRQNGRHDARACSAEVGRDGGGSSGEADGKDFHPPLRFTFMHIGHSSLQLRFPLCLHGLSSGSELFSGSNSRLPTSLGRSSSAAECFSPCFCICISFCYMATAVLASPESPHVGLLFLVNEAIPPLAACCGCLLKRGELTAPLLMRSASSRTLSPVCARFAVLTGPEALTVFPTALSFLTLLDSRFYPCRSLALNVLQATAQHQHTLVNMSETDTLDEVRAKVGLRGQAESHRLSSNSRFPGSSA
jgi:hypothetical protein